MKHLERHPERVDDCFGCKVLDVNFGSVPGGTRPMAKRKDHEVKFDKDMHAYREARRAGEQPDKVSARAVSETRRRVESVARGREKLAAFEIDSSHLKTGYDNA